MFDNWLLERQGYFIASAWTGWLMGVCLQIGGRRRSGGPESVFRLVEDAEAEDRSQYDWVLRSRPDMYWYDFHPPVCHFIPANAYANFATDEHIEVDLGFVDQHFLLPRGIATNIFRGMAEEYRNCKGGEVAYDNLETWLLQSLFTATYYGTNLRRHIFPAVIVRRTRGEPSARQMCRGVPLDTGECIRQAYPECNKPGEDWCPWHHEEKHVVIMERQITVGPR
eukprot:gnl/TRDRNA2_/TRDRNA2_82477_c1_seq1.p3 gnl/TRDRNA2_/TRDRNA2_82477_c1~~gnl/TRDRNA2_/TRDRNA2_82477_c1_seq1.p3  ORF type:complete len:224 (+),score=14.65 gnl/TRDRNA2_/TRDRNA2_82477_c1_seq1:206-877(+)